MVEIRLWIVNVSTDYQRKLLSLLEIVMIRWGHVKLDTSIAVRHDRGAPCIHAVHSNDTPRMHHKNAARWHRKLPPSRELISLLRGRHADHLNNSARGCRAAVEENVDQLLELKVTSPPSPPQPTNQKINLLHPSAMVPALSTHDNVQCPPKP